MKYRGSPQLRLNFSSTCNKFRRLQLATNTVNTHTVSHCGTQGDTAAHTETDTADTQADTADTQQKQKHTQHGVVLTQT